MCLSSYGFPCNKSVSTGGLLVILGISLSSYDINIRATAWWYTQWPNICNMWRDHSSQLPKRKEAFNSKGSFPSISGEHTKMAVLFMGEMFSTKCFHVYIRKNMWNSRHCKNFEQIRTSSLSRIWMAGTAIHAHLPPSAPHVLLVNSS